jgi:hypothetical protein
MGGRGDGVLESEGEEGKKRREKRKGKEEKVVLTQR